MFSTVHETDWYFLSIVEGKHAKDVWLHTDGCRIKRKTWIDKWRKCECRCHSGHMGSLNGLMSMKIMWILCYGYIFWNNGVYTSSRVQGLVGSMARHTEANLQHVNKRRQDRSTAGRYFIHTHTLSLTHTHTGDYFPLKDSAASL